MRQASDWQERQEHMRSAGGEKSADTKIQQAQAEGDEQREELVRLQLKRLFKELWGHVSCDVAWAMHRGGNLRPEIIAPMGEPRPGERVADRKDRQGTQASGLITRDELYERDRKEFGRIYSEERSIFRARRKAEIGRRRRARPLHRFDNVGYSEEDPEHEAAEGSPFDDAWRQKSIVEDLWKAEYNQMKHEEAKRMTPRGDTMQTTSDRLVNVAAAAYRATVLEQNRPVLTHELADFSNPYMMKQSALERLLSERCLRNQLDERCMPRLLEKHPDLTKLRAKAPLPPEVLEPLAAFRGDVRWHFDSRERLSQKLHSAASALDAVVAGGGVADVLESLPENADVAADQVQGVHHPWRNHVGFDSAVPRGMAGGTKFGQPAPLLQEQIQRLRYPTLQRVAHTLPRDPKWRAHVVRTINVLERSKGWDYLSKLNAVNKMKEVYDLFKPSEDITSAFDEKLMLNRVPSHLKRKYAKNKQYVKTYTKNFLKLKSWLRYRPSLTAREPMKVSDAKLKSTQKRK